MTEKMRRAEAGYCMLIILSEVDGFVHAKEDLIIKQFLEENKTLLKNPEKEVEAINNIAAEDYPLHFNNAMNDYYLDSTPAQRNHFLDLATRLVIADKEISPRENLFLNELYMAWEAAEEI